MVDTKANMISKANANDLPARLTDLRDVDGIGLGDTLQSMSPAASLGGRAASGWEEGIVVVTHTVTLATAGQVTHVVATTGTVEGPQGLTPITPAVAKECQVTYDTDGFPTLLFLAADVVTACAIQQTRTGKGVSAKLDANA